MIQIIRRNKLFLSILCIGIILRVIPAARNSLWVDEAHTLFESKNPSVSSIILGQADPPHTFLYHLIIRYVSEINTSPFFLRLPSLFFSFLNIYLIYRLATALRVNKIFGLACTVFFVFSPFQIEYSWWARMYSMVMFFALLSAYSFLRYYQSNAKAWLFFFTLANILGFYTDYSFFWYLAILNFSAIIFHSKINKKIALSILVSDIAAIGYLPIILANFAKIIESHVNWIPKPNYQILKVAVLWFYGFGDVWNKKLGDIWLFLCVLTIILSGYISYKNRLTLKYFQLSLITFLLPLTLSFLISYALKSSVFLAWNLWISSLFPVFITGLAVSYFLERKEKLMKSIGAVLAFFIIFLNLSLYWNTTGGIKNERKIEGRFYREVANLIREEVDLRQDLIVFIPDTFISLFNYYYYDFDNNQVNFTSDATDQDILEDDDSKTNLWLIINPYTSKGKNISNDIKDNTLGQIAYSLIKNKSPHKMSNVYKIGLRDLLKQGISKIEPEAVQREMQRQILVRLIQEAKIATKHHNAELTIQKLLLAIQVATKTPIASSERIPVIQNSLMREEYLRLAKTISYAGFDGQGPGILDTEWAKFFYNLGLISYTINEKEQVVQNLKSAVNFAPYWSYFHVELANYYLSAGKTEEARETLTYCLEFKDPRIFCLNFMKSHLPNNTFEKIGFLAPLIKDQVK